MITRAPVAILISVAALACTQAVEPVQQIVELRTDQAAYTVGQSAVVTLTNQGPSPIGPGNSAATLLCRLQVERLVTGQWEAGVQIGEACILIGLPPLGAGGSVQREIAIAREYFPSAGEYRFRVVVATAAGSGLSVASNTIGVAK